MRCLVGLGMILIAIAMTVILAYIFFNGFSKIDDEGDDDEL